MGQITFEVPPDLPATLRTGLGRSWFAGGYDGAPVPTTRKNNGDDQFTLNRDENEGGYLCVPWPDAAGIERVVTSSTLRLTDLPYNLLLELGRGSVNRVRTIVAALNSAGLGLPPDLSAEIKRITQEFGKIVSGSKSDTPFAIAVIDSAVVAADRCTAALTDYRLTTRKNAHGTLHTRLGCCLSKPLSALDAELYTAVFNAVRIVPDWQTIEPNEGATDWTALDQLVDWAISADLDISIGPLVDLANGRLPTWLDSWHADLPNLAAFLTDFIGTIINRYKDRVRTWHVFAGFNHADLFGLVEDDRLRLAARLLECTFELDPKADRVIALSQVWGDYLMNEDLTYSPLVFADTLMRAGLRPTALESELMGGTGPRSGERRDSLDAIHQFDLFDTLGLPQEVVTTGPNLVLLNTALGNPSVRAVYWDTWSAADPCSRTPAYPLIDSQGRPTEAYDSLHRLRTTWLS
jgi:hypothetical protein